MSARRLPRGCTCRRARGFILLSVVLALTLVAAVAFLLNRSGGMNMSLAARGLQADSARYAAEAGLAQASFQAQQKNCTGYTDLPTTTFGAASFTASVNPKAGSPVTLVATATTAGGAVATLTRDDVIVYQITPTSVTLQAADSTGKDTSLNSGNRTSNYGALVSIKVQGAAAYSGLIQFDLSTIPAGSTITGATLMLKKTTVASSSGTIAVYRVTTPWVEGTATGGISTSGATYNTSNGLIPWTTPGGDYDPAAVASLSNIVGGWNEWHVTNLAQGWMAASYPNYGMILVPTADVFSSFDSSDAASDHPKLVVTYTGPCV